MDGTVYSVLFLQVTGLQHCLLLRSLREPLGYRRERLSHLHNVSGYMRSGTL